MDIDRVRYFHVFADTGSLVKASEVLHISQPALSKALRLLEHEVGSKLLEAEGRGLRLTQSGIRFKKETASLLEQWLHIPQKITAGDLETPTKIGSFEVFTTYFLGHLTKFVDLENLEIHEFGAGKLEEAVGDHVVDIGITYIPIPKPGVEYTEVTKIKMGVFGLKHLKNKSLAELPFVVPLPPSEGTPTKIVGLDGWPDHKIKRNIKFQVTMMESALELCRRGKCAAYVPEFIVQLHNERMNPEYRLVEIPSPVPQKDRLQSVYLISRKQTKETALHRQIAKCLRSLT